MNNNTASQMDVLIPNNFERGKKYIPIAQITPVNAMSVPAINQYSAVPQSGTYVLGSVDGELKWIETSECQ
jgi:hypothetical protein